MTRRYNNNKKSSSQKKQNYKRPAKGPRDSGYVPDRNLDQSQSKDLSTPSIAQNCVVAPQVDLVVETTQAAVPNIIPAIAKQTSVPVGYLLPAAATPELEIASQHILGLLHKNSCKKEAPQMPSNEPPIPLVHQLELASQHILGLLRRNSSKVEAPQLSSNQTHIPPVNQLPSNDALIPAITMHSGFVTADVIPHEVVPDVKFQQLAVENTSDDITPPVKDKEILRIDGVSRPQFGSLEESLPFDFRAESPVKYTSTCDNGAPAPHFLFKASFISSMESKYGYFDSASSFDMEPGYQTHIEFAKLVSSPGVVFYTPSSEVQ